MVFCLDSFAIGGTELNAIRTAEALDPDRIALSVVHLQTHGPLRVRYEKLGVRMVHVPIRNLYSPNTMAQGVRLAALLREWDADVVHSHDIYCNLFAVPWARTLTRCAVIASRRWWYEAPRPALVTANRFAYRLAHRVLANSSGVAELLVREEHVPRSKIVQVPNFLSDASFSQVDPAERLAQRRAWGIPDDAFVVGIVARLSPVKNHAMLLRAVARLDPRSHLVIIGDGPLRSTLETQARDLGIAGRVHFTGELVSSRNLHQFLDVSVLVSLSEGFPNSLIEAMAAGRPTVATHVGGVTDAVVHNETGFLVSPDDAAGLADALQAIRADRAICDRVGEAARTFVRNAFRQDVVIDRLTDVYRSLSPRVAGKAMEEVNA